MPRVLPEGVDANEVQEAIEGALRKEVGLSWHTAEGDCDDTARLARIAASSLADAAMSIRFEKAGSEMCATLRLLSLNPGDVATLEEESACGEEGASLAATAARSLLGTWLSSRQQEDDANDEARDEPATFVAVPSTPVPEAAPKPPSYRLRGLLLGVALESDVLSYGSAGVSLAPALRAAWDGYELGGEVALIVTRPLGTRLDVRIFVLRNGRLRPYVGGGVTLFPGEFAAHAATGAHLGVGPVVLMAQVAYEYFLSNLPGSRDRALLCSLGVAYNL